jgi:hypothetical protein
VVVVDVRIDALEVGTEPELDQLELWKLGEDPVVPRSSHDLLAPVGAERDDPVDGHGASLTEERRARVRCRRSRRCTAASSNRDGAPFSGCGRCATADVATVLAVFERLGEESRRARFNGPKHCLTAAELRQLATIDSSHHALVRARRRRSRAGRDRAARARRP